MSLIIPELPEQHWHTAMALLTKAYPQPSSHLIAASAGRVFLRKGYDTTRALTVPASRDYESVDDDVVISVTLRLSREDAGQIGLPELIELMRDGELAELRRRRSEAQAEVDHVDAMITEVEGQQL